MKNQVLSIEQMKHLKELGVDVSKASMCWTKHINTEYPEIGTSFSLEASENASLGESPHEGYFWECVELTPAFTLQDMLEMMPKELKLKVEEYRTPIDCILIIDASSNCVAYEYNQWGCIGSAESFSDGAILGAVYKTLCWLAEKGHLTKKEEEEKDNCHVCGKTDVELSECECCGELYCEDCSSIYNLFTQIDYNCCKPCSKREGITHERQ